MRVERQRARVYRLGASVDAADMGKP